jgi:hypothetical protein
MQFSFLFFAVLMLKLRTSRLLGKGFTTWVKPPACKNVLTAEIRRWSTKEGPE